MSGFWSFIALGTPVSQGNKRAFPNPRGGPIRMVETSKNLKPWRDTIVSAAFGAGPKLEGPLTVVMAFTLPRPKSAPKSQTIPFKKPDIEKLARAVSDAVTSAGLWNDDAEVAELSLLKLWPNTSALSLAVPGVVVAAGEDDDLWGFPDVWDRAQIEAARNRAVGDIERVSTPTEAIDHIKHIREGMGR